MSYGWLTESALVPQPAKEVENVSCKSLVSLRALMLEKEQESKKRKLETGSTTTKPTEKFRSKMQKRLLQTNEGVHSRDDRDAEAQAASAKTFERSKQQLIEKAKLYEALTSGDMDAEEFVDAVGVPNNARVFRGKAVGLCLDVKKKEDERNRDKMNEQNKEDSQTSQPAAPAGAPQPLSSNPSFIPSSSHSSIPSHPILSSSDSINSSSVNSIPESSTPAITPKEPSNPINSSISTNQSNLIKSKKTSLRDRWDKQTPTDETSSKESKGNSTKESLRQRLERLRKRETPT